MPTLAQIPFVLALLAKATVFTAFCLVLGAASQKFIRRSGCLCGDQQGLFLSMFFSLSTGMCVITVILFLLGLSSLLSPGATALVLVVTQAIAAGYLWRRSESPTTVIAANQLLDWKLLAQCVFFAGLFVLVVLIAVCPPGKWDDTSYHLPYARYYIDNHAIVMNPYLRFPLFPHNGNLLFSLGLMYGTETDAQVLATLPLFVISLGLFGACHALLGSTSAGYLSVVVFFALGPVKEALGYAYVDNILALYTWGATLALALWLREPTESTHWLLTCGLLAGTAAGTKLFGGVMAFLIGLYLLMVVRKMRPTLIYTVTTLLFGLGWYVRSLYISGDPVHPAGGNIFGHFLWNAGDLLSQQQEQSTHGAEKGLFNIFGALQTAGILLLVPALLVFVQPVAWRRPTNFLYITFVFYLLFWMMSSQVARYLAPVLGLGAFLSVWFLYQAGLKTSLRGLHGQTWAPWLRGAGNLAVASCGLIMVYSGLKLVPPQLVNWDTVLRGRPGYEIMISATAQIPVHGKILLQVGYENAFYFFKGTAIGDWFGPGRYSNTLICEAKCRIAPAEQMVKVMNGFGAQMLAVNAKRFQFDPQQYTDFFDIKTRTEDGYLLILKK